MAMPCRATKAKIAYANTCLVNLRNDINFPVLWGLISLLNQILQRVYLIDTDLDSVARIYPDFINHLYFLYQVTSEPNLSLATSTGFSKVPPEGGDYKKLEADVGPQHPIPENLPDPIPDPDPYGEKSSPVSVDSVSLGRVAAETGMVHYIWQAPQIKFVVSLFSRVEHFPYFMLEIRW